MSKSLKNNRTFNDEYDYEYEDNNIEQRRKEDRERRKNRHKKDLELEELVEPVFESTSRNRKPSRN